MAKRKPSALTRAAGEVVAEVLKKSGGKPVSFGLLDLTRAAEHRVVVTRATQARAAGKRGGNKTTWEDRDDGTDLDQRGQTPTDALLAVLALTGVRRVRAVADLAKRTGAKPASVERRLRRLKARDPEARRLAEQHRDAHREAMRQEAYGDLADALPVRDIATRIRRG